MDEIRSQNPVGLRACGPWVNWQEHAATIEEPERDEWKKDVETSNTRTNEQVSYCWSGDSLVVRFYDPSTKEIRVFDCLVRRFACNYEFDPEIEG